MPKHHHRTALFLRWKMIDTLSLTFPPHDDDNLSKPKDVGLEIRPGQSGYLQRLVEFLRSM